MKALHKVKKISISLQKTFIDWEPYFSSFIYFFKLHVSLHPFQTEGSWGRHLRWRCIGKATGLALPITHRRGRHTPTQPAPHTAWALCSKISGMISVKLGVYSHFPSWELVQRRGCGSVECFSPRTSSNIKTACQMAQEIDHFVIRRGVKAKM